MGFLPLERAVMEANHAQFGGAGLVASLEIANRGAVLHLVDGALVWFRGRIYTVPAVPHLVSMRHGDLVDRLDRAARGEPHDVPALIAANVRLFRRWLRPVSRWRTVPWFLRPNPFRSATIAELGELNALFWIARTRCSVRPATATEAARRLI